MIKNQVINLKEIEIIYKEYCKRENIKFSPNNFIKFLNFLQIDFYDWVKDNLRYFFSEQNMEDLKSLILYKQNES